MERREYPRVKTCNLISYLSVRENGQIVDQSMGKALNVSQNGIFLETTQLILAEKISLMTVDPDNNLIEIEGKVVYSKESGYGKFGNGVTFQDDPEQTIKFVSGLIRVFYNRKNKFDKAVGM
jgi:hypothetical protein